jgi:phosphate transport system substrate-binding protein
MNYEYRAIRAKVLAGAVVLCLGMVNATGAAAASNLYGGGATLPAGAYVGFQFIGGSNVKLSANTPSNSNTTVVLPGNQFGQSAVDDGSLFGHWASSTGNAVSFCQTGSGNGKKFFNLTDGTNTLTSALPCDGSANTTRGFGAPVGVAVDPYFAASDAPISLTEYAQFDSPGGKAARYGEPVQFPAVAGSIAIIFQNSDIPSTTRLDLSELQICSVFNGAFTNWQQIDPTLPSRAIKVVYRSDSSGTSFSLANHLTAVCHTTNTGDHHFQTDQQFAAVAGSSAPASTSVVGQFFGATRNSPPALPTGWTGANGNGGILTEMAVPAENGAISYAESANLKAAVAAGTTNVAYATVGGKDPYVDFPNTVSFTVVQNFAINGVNATTGAPTIGVLTPLVAGTRCINIVNPTTYADVTTRYPIMAVSYLIANYQGNGSDASNIASLISSAYSVAGTSTHPGITTIGNDSSSAPVNGVKTGFAFLHIGLVVGPADCIKS